MIHDEALQDFFERLLPEQEDGLTITAAEKRSAASQEEAGKIFERAKVRLQDIFNWSALNGSAGADFMPIDSEGNIPDNGTAYPGLWIRINIPGPGTSAGKDYDWVQIEAVEDAVAPGHCGFGICVRPAAAPQHEDQDVAHFYAPQSTSTFMIYQSHREVKAMIVDRNTKINTNVHRLTDKIRNLIVGAGAITLFSKIQWSYMCKSLLEDPLKNSSSQS